MNPQRLSDLCQSEQKYVVGWEVDGRPVVVATHNAGLVAVRVPPGVSFPQPTVAKETIQFYYDSPPPDEAWDVSLKSFVRWIGATAIYGHVQDKRTGTVRYVDLRILKEFLTAVDLTKGPLRLSFCGLAEKVLSIESPSWPLKPESWRICLAGVDPTKVAISNPAYL